MKRFFLAILAIAAIQFAKAQQKAVTEKGDEVILYDDGTWKYSDTTSQQEKEIPFNETKFVKSAKSTFLLKSTKKADQGFWLNSQKWTFKKAVNNPDAEYELKLKSGDVYAIIIAEKVEIPLETLKKIALGNAKKASLDVEITKEEYRYVNGNKVLYMEMKGTIQGIKFAYIGYYYSDENGTIQFITYTAQNMIKGYMGEIQDLLNGMVVLKSE